MFPSISGSNLERRQFNLPGDFEGEINLVIIPFQMGHQNWIDVWVPPLKGLLARYPGVPLYETPVLSGFDPVRRWFIDGGMRAGIPDRATRAATITLYTDKRAFRQALAIPNEETIHLLLVDRQGRVHARVEGRYTADKLAALETALQQVQMV
ncbi:MAG TPA: hypothetical protein VER79_14635 [Candidatus Limnocylindrales bacterium]|nr:hypothetical protein [Candidatus Limnocylindrales bacterium]